MDMNQYLDLFLEESAEHLQSFNEKLLELEANPDRLDLLDEIFRAAHTLKGMSATMGYESIAQVTHKMENLLDKLRSRKIDLNANIFNCLFRSVDALESMTEMIKEGQNPQLEDEELINELLALEKGENYVSPKAKSEEKIENDKIEEKEEDYSLNIQFNEYEERLLKTAQEKGMQIWAIKVSIADSCLMKGVRAFMVFRNMESIGEIIKSDPSVQDIEDEKFDKSFGLVIVSSHHENVIKSKLDSISEVTLEALENIKELTVEKTEDEEPSKAEEIKQDKANGAGQKKQDTMTNGKKHQVHQTVRVDIGRLDKLMSLVGELVINKTRLEQINASQEMTGLNETIEQINRITTDLQSVVQNVRMVGIEQVFNRFPRMVRDLAKDLGKKVNLILEGKETELDRTVIDEIGDPLLHLIRNAIDHGLESPDERLALQKNVEGMLKLSAKHEGNHVIIEVEDDGKGINVEKIKQKAIDKGFLTVAQAENCDRQTILNLIFEPGFSTAKKVTDVSGRGVGLDVVKSKIQTLNGQIHLETQEGEGTRFVVKLPLTLAIIQALLVKTQAEIYAIPLGNIDETTSLEHQQIKNVQGQQVMVLRGKVLPLVFIKDILAVPGNKEQKEMYVVVVRKGEQQIGLVVDELVGQQEIVINSLGKLLTGLPGIAGASVLGDGRVSLILDIGTLF